MRRFGGATFKGGPTCVGRVLIFVILAVSAHSAAVAAEKPTGADFLRIEPSARAAAMGGGFGALAEDVHALYYNPAGLAMVGRTQLTATHTPSISPRRPAPCSST